MRKLLRFGCVFFVTAYSASFAAGNVIVVDPQPASKNGFSLNLEGGLNIAGKSDMRAQDTLPSFTNFAGGISLWYGSLLRFGEGFFAFDTQAGLFAGYVPTMLYTDTTSGKKSSDIKFPIIIDLRVMNHYGLFAGLGGGYAHTVITTIGITEATGPAAVVSTLLGWEYSPGYGITLGITVRGMYFIQQIENVNGTRSKNNQINVLPLLQVGYRF